MGQTKKISKKSKTIKKTIRKKRRKVYLLKLD